MTDQNQLPPDDQPMYEVEIMRPPDLNMLVKIVDELETEHVDGRVTKRRQTITFPSYLLTSDIDDDDEDGGEPMGDGPVPPDSAKSILRSIERVTGWQGVKLCND